MSWSRARIDSSRIAACERATATWWMSKGFQHWTTRLE
jgi:hypothetical protein